MSALWLCLGLATGCCGAGQVLQEFDWQKLAENGRLTAGTPMVIDGKTVLKVVNTNDTPLLAQIFPIEQPPVTKNVYAVKGEVKYEQVKGDGYLEMWNHFPPIKPGQPDGAYFSRTLAIGGDLGKISGTSGWRKFLLPFDRTGAGGPPTNLQINLYLPGPGTVYLSPVKLVQYETNWWESAVGGAWWSDREAGLFGGIGGAAIGCLGSLLAWLAAKGRSRTFVLGATVALIVLGAVAGLAGLVAVGTRQPYAVWFSLLLFAVLLLGICPFRLRQYRRHYEQTELRRMAAIDAEGYRSVAGPDGSGSPTAPA